MDSVVQRWEPTRGLERFCPPLHHSRCSWRTIEVMAGIKIGGPQLTTEPFWQAATPGATFSFFAGDFDFTRRWRGADDTSCGLVPVAEGVKREMRAWPPTGYRSP